VTVVILVSVILIGAASLAALAEERVLRVGLSGDVETLDGDFSRYPIANTVILNTYEQWFRYGPMDSGEGYTRSNVNDMRGAAVESWELAADRLSLVVNVRQGVSFPMTGNPLTADDLMYWYKRGIGNQSGINWNLQAAGIENFEKLDTYTVRVNFFSPMQDMFFMLGRDQCWGVVDSLEAKNHATADDPWANEWLAKNYAGCGEFIVESWEAGVRMVLVANKDYWAGVPHFDKVILEIIPSSASRALLLQEGSIDIAMGLSPDETDRLKGSPDVEVLSILSRSLAVINLNCRIFPFSNLLLRQAVAYLIPYDTILEEVFGGQGFVPESPIPVLGKGHNDNYWNYEYNVEEARDRLERAGFPDGFEFTVNVRSGESAGRTIGILLQDAMKPLGIQVNIREVPPAVFAEEEAKGLAQGSMWSSGYLMYVDDPWYGMRGFLPESATNRMKYTNYAVGWIYEELRENFDPEERQELVDLWQQIVIWDSPRIFLAEHAIEYPMRRDIQGFMFLEDSNLWFYPLYRE